MRIYVLCVCTRVVDWDTGVCVFVSCVVINVVCLNMSDGYFCIACWDNDGGLWY